MKSKVILDFSDCQSVKESILRSYRTDDLSIINFVEELSVPYMSHPPDFLLEAVCEKFCYPHYEYDAIWFHGTRASNTNSFMEFGVLPKTKFLPTLVDMLTGLSNGLARKGENPFSPSLAGKQTSADEGPFGVLFKTVAISPTGAAHNYCEVPESVEDIAGSLLGENYGELVAKFKAKTKLFVVSFIAEANMEQLSRGLWYTNLRAKNVSIQDAANCVTTCYNSKGLTIMPDKIRSIECVGHA